MPGSRSHSTRVFFFLFSFLLLFTLFGTLLTYLGVLLESLGPPPVLLLLFLDDVLGFLVELNDQLLDVAAVAVVVEYEFVQ